MQYAEKLSGLKSMPKPRIRLLEFLVICGTLMFVLQAIDNIAHNQPMSFMIIDFLFAYALVFIYPYLFAIIVRFTVQIKVKVKLTDELKKIENKSNAIRSFLIAIAVFCLIDLVLIFKSETILEVIIILLENLLLAFCFTVVDNYFREKIIP